MGMVSTRKNQEEMKDRWLILSDHFREYPQLYTEYLVIPTMTAQKEQVGLIYEISTCKKVIDMKSFLTC